MEFATTDTELKAIAIPAIIGLSKNIGYKNCKGRDKID
jgi:hypothetical protein